MNPLPPPATPWPMRTNLNPVPLSAKRLKTLVRRSLNRKTVPVATSVEECDAPGGSCSSDSARKRKAPPVASDSETNDDCVKRHRDNGVDIPDTANLPSHAPSPQQIMPHVPMLTPLCLRAPNESGVPPIFNASYVPFSQRVFGLNASASTHEVAETESGCEQTSQDKPSNSIPPTPPLVPRSCTLPEHYPKARANTVRWTGQTHVSPLHSSLSNHTTHLATSTSTLPADLPALLDGSHRTVDEVAPESTTLSSPSTALGVTLASSHQGETEAPTRAKGKSKAQSRAVVKLPTQNRNLR
ncbi:hypothetical protein FB45DRAFT_122897 [Roridomyces roridus]|uniref:Uncharacterized protein n=1 Tax=Roridomyces roridus TaxID=1738132 RepID=A0AAD7BIV1_9AGAR|nr:hypothetical protein FB45DRAFT_122897 [Roridomyces roridus]